MTYDKVLKFILKEKNQNIVEKYCCAFKIGKNKKAKPL